MSHHARIDTCLLALIGAIVYVLGLLSRHNHAPICYVQASEAIATHSSNKLAHRGVGTEEGREGDRGGGG